ncbi:TonB-dependent receptor [Gayadomonas joobiniege]|uniref:TonB-dependent receptor n=1 Tax=Gayadomonas joobiniege TaxID=1234606 RepID=UPI000367E7DB|nr:TonB-dependent receptor [Gayadomonas joobiniege]
MKLKHSILPVTLAVITALNSHAAEKEPEVIKVSGIRSSLTESMDIKKNAPSIQDSIVAEDIGKFPDQNVAESLQRITGVSISRTNGEGAKVTVRGFGPKFNAVKINHRTIATTDRGREFDFQVLPSELISGADVIKASRANIAEGSLGAYVNVTTAKPLRTPGLQAAGSVHVRYNDLAEEYDPKFSGIVSNTFLNNTFGVLVGLSHLSVTNRIDSAGSNFWETFDAANTEWAPGPITDTNGNAITSGKIWYPGRAYYSSDTEERERTSFNTTLQWAPTEDLTHTFDLLYSDFSREALSNGIQVPLQYAGWQDVIVSENGTALAATKAASPIDGLFKVVGESSDTLAAGWNTELYVDNWKFNVDLAYSKAEATPQNNQFVPHFVNPDVDQSVKPGDPGYQPNQELGLIEGQDYIKFDSRGGDIITIDSTVDTSDPAAIRAHWNDTDYRNLEDEVIEFKFDASYEIEHEFLRSIDMGFAYTDREKSKQVFNNPYNCYNEDLPEDEQVNICGTSLDLADDFFAINSDADFLADEPGDFPRDFVLITDLPGYIEAIGDLRKEPDWAVELPKPSESVRNTEETFAVYGQANFDGEYDHFLWSGNFGLRYVSTETESFGYRKERISIERDYSNGTSSDGVLLSIEYTDPLAINEGTDYNELLPSVNVNLDFENGFYLKGAAAKVITRPAIEDIGVDRAYSDVRAGDFAQTGGNPYLQPYKATQFDLSLEHYDDSGNSYSVGLFHKKIDSFISQSVTSVPTGVTIEDWGPLNELVTEKTNRDGGSVTGAEIAGLHYFDYLPGWMSGFGVQANYTYSDSEDDNIDAFEQENVLSPGTGVEGLSKHAYNLIAFYDKDGFQARIAYNWRDKFLNLRQGNNGGSLPHHVDEYGQLDFSTSYDIDENITLSAEAINLTNENILEYADVRERVTLVSYSGRRLQAGITIKY